MLNKKRVSNLKNRIKTHEDIEKEIRDFKDLIKNDPETAKIVARIALIRTGVLNENGSSKENIVDYPYTGYEITSKTKRRIRK